LGVFTSGIVRRKPDSFGENSVIVSPETPDGDVCLPAP
jgi:hypothetical protein